MSTITQFTRRGHLYSGPRQFSEGWPLLRQPITDSDPYPWVCPQVNPALERWSDAQVVEPIVQPISDQTAAFLEQCYSRGLDVAVTTTLWASQIAIWRVSCPNHRLDHAQSSHRCMDVWVCLSSGAVDTVELVDPDQTDDALARVRLDAAEVRTWLDLIAQEVTA